MKTYAPASPGGGSADAEWFSVEELETARENYLAEQEKELPSPQVKLRYAIALAKSKKRDDKYRGIGLLDDLLDESYSPRECLYWIALTYYGLGEYRASRSHCERLIRMDPGHTKALALRECIREVTSQDGIVGVGLVGAVVVVGLALKLLLRR
ncbi:hypothetical protein PybrP1_009074 [[Pythium] brassicae (nom. inval.)]|nr:hypothetical protein PybrP1_009074 [[Pythium] brassicae (nom. inval.)]